MLSSPEAIKQLSNVLKTNVSACVSIGSFFLPQIGRIYEDMLSLYKAVSGMISAEVASRGLLATKTPMVRGMRTIKKEVLKLIETYIKKAEDLEAVKVNLIPSLLDAVLNDYNGNTPAARDAEVLNVMTTIVTRLGVRATAPRYRGRAHVHVQPLITDRVGDILAAVFECTLQMINQDFSEFPEHRVAFFKLLRAINLHCFPGASRSPPSLANEELTGTQRCARWSRLSSSSQSMRSSGPSSTRMQRPWYLDGGATLIWHRHRDIAETGLK
jgi:exportin-1